MAHLFNPARFTNSFLAAVSYFCFGVLTGAISLFFFSHSILPPRGIHGLSLIVSPVLTGAAMSFLGGLLRKMHKRITRIESFSYGFAFALGVALVRFVFTRFLLG